MSDDIASQSGPPREAVVDFNPPPIAARPPSVDVRGALRDRAAALARDVSARPTRQSLLEYLALRRFLRR